MQTVMSVGSVMDHPAIHKSLVDMRLPIPSFHSPDLSALIASSIKNQAKPHGNGVDSGISDADILKLPFSLPAAMFQSENVELSLLEGERELHGHGHGGVADDGNAERTVTPGAGGNELSDLTLYNTALSSATDEEELQQANATVSMPLQRMSSDADTLTVGADNGFRPASFCGFHPPISAAASSSSSSSSSAFSTSLPSIHPSAVTAGRFTSNSISPLPILPVVYFENHPLWQPMHMPMPMPMPMQMQMQARMQNSPPITALASSRTPSPWPYTLVGPTSTRLSPSFSRSLSSSTPASSASSASSAVLLTNSRSSSLGQSVRQSETQSHSPNDRRGTKRRPSERDSSEPAERKEEEKDDDEECESAVDNQSDGIENSIRYANQQNLDGVGVSVPSPNIRSASIGSDDDRSLSPSSVTKTRHNKQLANAVDQQYRQQFGKLYFIPCAARSTTKSGGDLYEVLQNALPMLSAADSHGDVLVALFGSKPVWNEKLLNQLLSEKYCGSVGGGCSCPVNAMNAAMRCILKRLDPAGEKVGESGTGKAKRGSNEKFVNNQTRHIAKILPVVESGSFGDPRSLMRKEKVNGKGPERLVVAPCMIKFILLRYRETFLGTNATLAHYLWEMAVRMQRSHPLCQKCTSAFAQSAMPTITTVEGSGANPFPMILSDLSAYPYMHMHPLIPSSTPLASTHTQNNVDNSATSSAQCSALSSASEEFQRTLLAAPLRKKHRKN